jgi:hypothetical protein
MHGAKAISKSNPDPQPEGWGKNFIFLNLQPEGWGKN